MKLLRLCMVLIVSISAVHAEVSGVDFDKVQPFAEPEPVTDEEKAAVKFKPQLKFVDGCRPYPAVDAYGGVSGGFRHLNRHGFSCNNPTMGSQVYSRADWYDDKWAIMYAWYLPRNSGRPHGWVWAIVWIDDPALETSTILGVSTPEVFGYDEGVPPEEKNLDGSSVKLELYVSLTGKSVLKLTEDEGEQQDLIQWDQLTEAARDSLNNFDFDASLWGMADVECPLKDEVFTEKIEKASPF